MSSEMLQNKSNQKRRAPFKENSSKSLVSFSPGLLVACFVPLSKAATLKAITYTFKTLWAYPKATPINTALYPSLSYLRTFVRILNVQNLTYIILKSYFDNKYLFLFENFPQQDY